MGRLIFVSFGLLVVFLSLSGTAADCPSGWSSYEGHCYRPFKQEMTWADAENFCTQQHAGGHLVSFHSTEEADFVVKLSFQTFGQSIFWIGLSNVWNPCSSISYENLVDPFECFMVRKDASRRNWFNVDCRQQLSFMCKFTRPR